MIKPGASSRARRKRSGVAGHCGIVRLWGKDIEPLRVACYERDHGRCVECGVAVHDDLPDWHDDKFHMAHIRNRRMYGDVLENVRTLCGREHRAEHAGRLKRPI
jgi:hypothetical protein